MFWLHYEKKETEKLLLRPSMSPCFRDDLQSMYNFLTQLINLSSLKTLLINKRIKPEIFFQTLSCETDSPETIHMLSHIRIAAHKARDEQKTSLPSSDPLFTNVPLREKSSKMSA